MEQNNFEKNVQHKLDELKIPPSDSVWANVEKQIRKKEKDKKFILLFLLSIIFLLSASYWLMNSSKNNVQNHKMSQFKKDSKAINNQDSSFAKPEIASGNLANIDSTSVSSGKTKNFKPNSQNKIVEKRKINPGMSDDLTSKPNQDFSKQRNNQHFPIALSKLIRKTTNAEIENKNESENIANNFQNHINTDSFLINLKSGKTIQKLITKNNTSPKKDSAKKPGKRVYFAVTISAGTSLLGSNILERSYPAMDLNAGLPSGGISNGGGSSYYYNPSPIKNSTAFMAGVLTRKDISAKTKISVGISYKYYSFTNKVGKKIDSILMPSQYYSANNFNNAANRSNTYRNNFHYLEIPVSVNIQINKNQKLPVFWNAGIDFSELLSSNALQFKSNPGVYYSDNSIFNKTQIGLHTGLSFTLFSQQKMPVAFGPYIYYSATSISDKGLYGAKHFSFIGIQTEILFRKK